MSVADDLEKDWSLVRVPHTEDEPPMTPAPPAMRPETLEVAASGIEARTLATLSMQIIGVDTPQPAYPVDRPPMPRPSAVDSPRPTYALEDEPVSDFNVTLYNGPNRALLLNGRAVPPIPVPIRLRSNRVCLNFNVTFECGFLTSYTHLGLSYQGRGWMQIPLNIKGIEARRVAGGVYVLANRSLQIIFAKPWYKRALSWLWKHTIGWFYEEDKDASA